MNFNFELILFYAVVICGAIALIDIIFFAKQRRLTHERQTRNSKQRQEIQYPVLVEYARSFFPVLLLVFVLRSFLYEPYRIPSGSLVPTLLVGDFVLVNKFDYGIRIPVVHKKIVNMHEPKRGDIMVFRYPPKPSINYIKRVVGIPGDHISYIGKQVYINGKPAPQTFKEDVTYLDEQNNSQDAELKIENLDGVDHTIYQFKNTDSADFRDIVVPANQYFVMGDNRDDSADSRYWGFVPNENIIGKAVITWMSWDADKYRIRWSRLLKKIH